MFSGPLPLFCCCYFRCWWSMFMLYLLMMMMFMLVLLTTRAMFMFMLTIFLRSPFSSIFHSFPFQTSSDSTSAIYLHKTIVHMQMPFANSANCGHLEFPKELTWGSACPCAHVSGGGGGGGCVMCDVMWCGEVWYYVRWSGMMGCNWKWCGVVWCDMTWHGVKQFDMRWWDVIWHDMMCDGVM